MAVIKFEVIKAEYAGLWQSSDIRESHKAECLAMARRIINGRLRYIPVGHETGVPWYVIGIIHAMECGLSWKQHLHNGDPLKARTRQVPKGRPVTGEPPFTWEESAIDALRYDGLDKVTDWSLERIAFCFEKFNGWGSRAKGIHSPYLWSYTTAYTSGKYIADHVWSATAVSAQPGAMALLKALVEIDATLIGCVESPPQPQAWPKARDPESPSPPTTARMATESKTLRLQVGAVGCAVVAKVQAVALAIGGGFAWFVEQLPDISRESGEHVSAVKDAAQLVGASEVVAGMATTLGIIFAVLVVVRHLRDRQELHALKQEATQ